MINQPDYTYYVVIRTGEIESGWSYKSDALDHLRDEPERLAGAKVVAKRSLKVDPNDDFNWAMNPYATINPAARRNPSRQTAPTAKAVEKFREFWSRDPKRIVAAPRFKIPARVQLAGAAVDVLYKSTKADPSTGIKPSKPIDYIHDHDPGTKVYIPDPRGSTAVPAFISGVKDLVLLGHCLGFTFDDGTDAVEGRVSRPYPELYTIPSGKALLVIEDDRTVLAIIWGGKLGVEHRGIVH